MDANEYKIAEKNIRKQLSDVEQNLKHSRHRLEDYTQFSKESRTFLQETVALFRGSSDSHLFSGILEEQAHIDKKIVLSLEEEQEELVREQRQLLQQQEELQSQYKNKEES